MSINAHKESSFTLGDVTFLHLSTRLLEVDEVPGRLPEEECECDCEEASEEAHLETRNSDKVSERTSISRLEDARRKRRAAKAFVARTKGTDTLRL